MNTYWNVSQLQTLIQSLDVYNLSFEPIYESYNKNVAIISSNNDAPNLHQHPGFCAFVRNLLSLTNMSASNIEAITSPTKLIEWTKAFTTPSNSSSNYEFLELLGDSILNCCIVFYLKSRFPKLCTPASVRYLARLKIELVSKQTFSAYARKLNFDQFIRASADERSNGKLKNSVLEDCFEAFFGCLMQMCEEFGPNYGYTCCSVLVKHLMDQENISLKQEDLFDAKSRLKELFDHLRDYELIYDHKCTMDAIAKTRMFTTKISVKLPTQKIIVCGTGNDFSKKGSEQIAAKNAINDLKARKIFVETFTDMSHAA